MSNLFEEVLDDVKKVEEKLLGPSYPYWKNIKDPTQIGMSDNGSLSTLGKDIDGLVNYVELLVTGSGNASVTGRPLGNKFFLKTGGKCVDTITGEDVDRYIYINNVPQGNIPFISSGMGKNFSDFKGLIPGVVSDLNVLNPFAIMQSFLSGSKPPCQAITMQTIDVNNIPSMETHFVTTTDIKNTDPCSFPNRINPVNGKVCSEAFQPMVTASSSSPSLPDDPIVQLYFASLSILTIYIFYNLINKIK